MSRITEFPAQLSLAWNKKKHHVRLFDKQMVSFLNAELS